MLSIKISAKILSVNGMMGISIQQRKRFAQIAYNCNYKNKNIYGRPITHVTHQVLVTRLTHDPLTRCQL
jgi:hypothetical protein